MVKTLVANTGSVFEGESWLADEASEVISAGITSGWTGHTTHLVVDIVAGFAGYTDSSEGGRETTVGTVGVRVSE